LDLPQDSIFFASFSLRRFLHCDRAFIFIRGLTLRGRKEADEGINSSFGGQAGWLPGAVYANFKASAACQST
jgi:hypothetical protein